jgi:hypothetical protein
MRRSLPRALRAAPPNTRMQRPRSSPSAPHSPRTRRPLGARRGVAALVLAFVLSSWSGAAESQAVGPVLISPNFGPVFVTFAGYGEIGRVLVPRLVIGGETPGAMWLQLHNNTIWPIVFATDSGYAISGPDWTAGAVLKEWMQTSIRYGVEDERGLPIPEARGDLMAESAIAPGRSVLFRVTPAALKTGQSIHIEYRYAWEPNGYVYEYQSRVDQRVVIGSGIVPSPENK